jgi:hypothetical protein
MGRAEEEEGAKMRERELQEVSVSRSKSHRTAATAGGEAEDEREATTSHLLMGAASSMRPSKVEVRRRPTSEKAGIRRLRGDGK